MPIGCITAISSIASAPLPIKKQGYKYIGLPCFRCYTGIIEAFYFGICFYERGK